MLQRAAQNGFLSLMRAEPMLLSRRTRRRIAAKPAAKRQDSRLTGTCCLCRAVAGEQDCQRGVMCKQTGIYLLPDGEMEMCVRCALRRQRDSQLQDYLRRL